MSVAIAASAPLGAPAPTWLHQGRPTALAEEALALLAEADSHGLNPAD